MARAWKNWPEKLHRQAMLFYFFSAQNKKIITAGGDAALDAKKV
jgi:hypothetical protein